jgi:hypothetical protein
MLRSFGSVSSSHEVKPDAASRRNQRSSRWALGCFVVGYNVTHHNGLFGSNELWLGSRFADWPAPRWLMVAAIGSILYVEGHGIHLSANSISNVVVSSDAPKATVDIVHLWDEVAGHYLWYFGLATVIAVCARSVRGRALGIPAVALAMGGAACGITWATNGLEGGTAVVSLAAAVLAAVPAIRRSRGVSIALATAGCVAATVLIVYAAMHGGFPQPSSL